MLRRVPQPPESGCRKCKGPRKCILNAKLQMLDFRSRPVYLKILLTRNGFTQITGTPSKPTLNARGVVTNFVPTKVHLFPVFLQEIPSYCQFFSNLPVDIHRFSVPGHNCQQLQYSLYLGLCYSYSSNERHLLVLYFKPPNLSTSHESIHCSTFLQEISSYCQCLFWC